MFLLSSPSSNILLLCGGLHGELYERPYNSGTSPWLRGRFSPQAPGALKARKSRGASRYKKTRGAGQGPACPQREAGPVVLETPEGGRRRSSRALGKRPGAEALDAVAPWEPEAVPEPRFFHDFHDARHARHK